MAAKLTMVATDGRRLALVEHEVDFPPEGDAEMILPTKAVSELMRILCNDGDLKIYSQKNQVVFELGTTMLSSIGAGRPSNPNTASTASLWRVSSGAGGRAAARGKPSFKTKENNDVHVEIDT